MATNNMATDTSVDQAKGSPPSAKIRPFNSATDLKVVRYLIGASVMEPSSLANQAALLSPIVIFIWIIVTHLCITRFSQGYPTLVRQIIHDVQTRFNLYSTIRLQQVQHQTLTGHFFEWLTISPILVAPPIALLALFELRHRNLFEDEMRNVIGQQDMRDIDSYYGLEQGQLVNDDDSDSKEGKKGMFVMEYEERIIGVVALDGRLPGSILPSIVDQIDGNDTSTNVDNAVPNSAKSSSVTSTNEQRTKLLRSRKHDTNAKSTSSSDTQSSLANGVLHIRRFATSLSFRSADIEDDLLSYVASFAFKNNSTTKAIVIQLRPFIERRLQQRLIKNGFKLASNNDTNLQIQTRQPVERGLAIEFRTEDDGVNETRLGTISVRKMLRLANNAFESPAGYHIANKIKDSKDLLTTKIRLNAELSSATGFYIVTTLHCLT
ncbi:hypothetical protein OIO90_002320 [Microbotryomycetes sp. JL221]|nr:hypothetical protein OIO90_002320 [Microbotryomycetes sp. JL221]